MNANTPATARPKSAIEIFGAAVTTRKAAYAAVLPKHLNADRFVRSAMIAVARTPKLLDCRPDTMKQALQTAATLGLEVSGVLGSAYLVPYKDTVQLIPGYRGLIALARQSGEVTSIDAYVVHEADTCHITLGTDPKIEHEPKLDGDPGKLRLVYAVAKLVGGGVQFVAMTKAEVDAIRARSKASGSGPWVTDYEEMSKKTVIRRLMKYLPLSVEKLARALELDDAVDTGKPAPPETIDATAFASFAADSAAATEAEGAPGSVDAALERTESATRKEPEFLGQPQGDAPAEQGDGGAAAVEFARRRAARGSDNGGLPR